MEGLRSVNRFVMREVHALLFEARGFVEITVKDDREDDVRAREVRLAEGASA